MRIFFKGITKIIELRQNLIKKREKIDEYLTVLAKNEFVKKKEDK